MLNSYDDHRSVLYIEELLKNKQYFHNVPGFQNNIDIFKEQDVVWLKYKNSLVRSVKDFLKKEIKIVDISSWVYKSDKDTTSLRDHLWHDHLFKDDSEVDQKLPNKLSGGQSMLCGIYYLKISKFDDIETVGTEFDIEGNKFFLRPVYNSWIIFEPNLLHRAGITKFERYTLATDVIYETGD